MAFTKIAAAGIGSTELVTLHSLEVLNNATVGGVLTYEDVTNVDSIGIVTARAGVLVGSGITLSKDGDIFATGVTTTGSLVSNGNIDVASHIRHIGDTDTKISFDTNIIHFDTDNNERFRIDSAGRVLIGGTSAIIGSSSAFNEIVLGGKTRGAGITLQDVDANVRFQIRTDDDSSGTLGTLLNASTNHPIVIRTNNTERVSIGSSGIVRTPYSVAFSATGSADNLDIDAGDKVAFNNISGGGGAIGANRTTYNSTNVFNTSTYAFTAPVAGLYLFTVSFYFRAVNGSVATQFVLAINGTEVNHSNHMILMSVYAVEGLQPNSSQILDLSAGDVITVHRRTAGQSGTSRVYMPHSYFSGCLIG